MVNDYKAINIIPEERDMFITTLTEELPILRTKLNLSQDELGSLIGVSRQTYSSIETKKRKMTWSIYLSLILIFDNSIQTHEFIRKQGIYPFKLFEIEGMAKKEHLIELFLREEDTKSKLDEQAIHAIETVIMMEYARCNNMTGEAVIKAFTGTTFTQYSEKDVIAKKALTAIKEKSNI